MAEINVSALAMVHAPPDDVRAAIADYRDVRPAILTKQFRDYQVIDGGHGAGSRVRWTLKPGRWGKRGTREWEVLVEESDGEVIERDTRSDVVTTWTVLPGPDQRSVVKVTLSWPGAEGFAGMRERSHAGRLRRAYGEMLNELRDRVARSRTAAPAEPDPATEPPPSPTTEPSPQEPAPPAGEARPQ